MPRPDHLRLVETPAAPDLPRVLTDPRARNEFERLTQALVDAAIEIIDLAHGDPDLEESGDLEPNGDEEDGDGGGLLEAAPSRRLWHADATTIAVHFLHFKPEHTAKRFHALDCNEQRGLLGP
jgi:hypothetical protein